MELPHTTTRLPEKNSQAFPLSWYTELSLVTKNSASDIQISLGNTFEVCPLFCHRKDCSSQKIYFFKNTTNNHMVCLLQLCGLVSSISFPSFASMLSISQCDCVIAYRCTLIRGPSYSASLQLPVKGLGTHFQDQSISYSNWSNVMGWKQFFFSGQF